MTLMNARVIALLAGDRERWPLAGDQLYVDLDLSPENLPPGTRLTIGSALVEVTDVPHTGCAKFTERFGPAAIRFVNSPSGSRAPPARDARQSGRARDRPARRPDPQALTQHASPRSVASRSRIGSRDDGRGAGRWHGRTVKPETEHRQLCTIELIAEGHADRCPGADCAFWEHGLRPRTRRGRARRSPGGRAAPPRAPPRARGGSCRGARGRPVPLRAPLERGGAHFLAGSESGPG